MKKLNSYAMIALLVFSMIGGLFIVAPDQAEAGSGDFVDWGYYKVIPINNPLDLYQMFINVTKTTGGVIDCENHCQDDFGDIRFANITDNSSIDYYLEDYKSGEYAHFWVETPSSASITARIVMWYGTSASSTTTSNGTNTFLFFDDFETGDFSQWNMSLNVKGGGTVAINTTVTFLGDYSARLNTSTVADTAALETNVVGWKKDACRIMYRFYKKEATDTDGRAFLPLSITDQDVYDYIFLDYNNQQYCNDGGWTPYSEAATMETGSWHNVTLQLNRTGDHVFAYVNDSYVGSAFTTILHDSYLKEMSFNLTGCDAHDIDILLDNVYLANWTTATEPTWGTPSLEKGEAPSGVTSVCIDYTVDMTDVKGIGNSVFGIVGVILIVSAVFGIIIIIKKYDLI